MAHAQKAFIAFAILLAMHAHQAHATCAVVVGTSQPYGPVCGITFTQIQRNTTLHLKKLSVYSNNSCIVGLKTQFGSKATDTRLIGQQSVTEKSISLGDSEYITGVEVSQNASCITYMKVITGKGQKLELGKGYPGTKVVKPMSDAYVFGFAGTALGTCKHGLGQLQVIWAIEDCNKTLASSKTLGRANVVNPNPSVPPKALAAGFEPATKPRTPVYPNLSANPYAAPSPTPEGNLPPPTLSGTANIPNTDYPEPTVSPSPESNPNPSSLPNPSANPYPTDFPNPSAVPNPSAPPAAPVPKPLPTYELPKLVPTPVPVPVFNISVPVPVPVPTPVNITIPQYQVINISVPVPVLVPTPVNVPNPVPTPVPIPTPIPIPTPVPIQGPPGSVTNVQVQVPGAPPGVTSPVTAICTSDQDLLVFSSSASLKCALDYPGAPAGTIAVSNMASSKYAQYSGAQCYDLGCQQIMQPQAPPPAPVMSYGKSGGVEVMTDPSSSGGNWDSYNSYAMSHGRRKLLGWNPFAKVFGKGAATEVVEEKPQVVYVPVPVPVKVPVKVPVMVAAPPSNMLTAKCSFAVCIPKAGEQMQQWQQQAISQQQQGQWQQQQTQQQPQWQQQQMQQQLQQPQMLGQGQQQNQLQGQQQVYQQPLQQQSMQIPQQPQQMQQQLVQQQAQQQQAQQQQLQQQQAQLQQQRQQQQSAGAQGLPVNDNTNMQMYANNNMANMG